MIRIWSAFALASATIALTIGSAAADDEMTTTRDATAVKAGSAVAVTGRCPTNTVPHLYGYLDAAETEGGFSGEMQLSVDSDGSFATPFPIPVESPSGYWIIGVSCIHDDVAEQPVEIHVEGSTPEAGLPVEEVAPETVHVRGWPNPAIPGSRLAVAGSGCIAQGLPIDRSYVSLSIGNLTGDPHSAKGTFVTKTDGSWSGQLEIPIDFPTGTAALYMQCDDTKPGFQPQPRWGRVLQIPFDVAAAPTTTSQSVAAAVSTTTSHRSVLPNTGPRNAVPLTMFAFLIGTLGAALAISGGRRRRAA